MNRARMKAVTEEREYGVAGIRKRSSTVSLSHIFGDREGKSAYKIYVKDRQSN